MDKKQFLLYKSRLLRLGPGRGCGGGGGCSLLWYKCVQNEENLSKWRLGMHLIGMCRYANTCVCLRAQSPPAPAELSSALRRLHTHLREDESEPRWFLWWEAGEAPLMGPQVPLPTRNTARHQPVAPF